MGEYTFHTSWGYAHLMCGALFTYLFTIIFHRIQYGSMAKFYPFSPSTLKRGLIGGCVFHLLYELKDFLANYRIEPGLSMQRALYGLFYGVPGDEIKESVLDNSPINSVGDIFYYSIGQFLAFLMLTHEKTRNRVGAQILGWSVCLAIFIANDDDDVTEEVIDIQVKKLKAVFT